MYVICLYQTIQKHTHIITQIPISLGSLVNSLIFHLFAFSFSFSLSLFFLLFHIYASFELDSLPYLNPSVDRRIAFITGGSSGLGFYSVLQLYLHGYTVYIAGRSKSRCLKSIKELKNKAIDIRLEYTSLQLNERFLGDLRFLEIDLSNLNLVISAVENFKKLEDHLHILINNAGAMALPYTLTIDKFEIQLQTNFCFTISTNN